MARHSGLSEILLTKEAFILKTKKVSGQAGMTKCNVSVIGRLTLLYLLSISILFFICISLPRQHERISNVKVLQPAYAQAADKPQFMKEGTLTFLAKKSRQEIAKIDIEIADNDFERTRGLMYRISLPDNAGMLFMFQNSGPRSFWMRNTYISLDIIFADEKNKIVAIHKKAEPLSYKAIKAENARYVIEVNAGFCDKYNIKVGDSITFQRITLQHPTPSP